MPSGEHLRTYSKRWLRKRSVAELERLITNLPVGSPAIHDIARALAERRQAERRGARLKWFKLALGVALASALLVLWKFRYLFISAGP